jgi:hypothetical protein
MTVTSTSCADDFVQQMKDGYVDDPYYQKPRPMLQNVDGLWYFLDRVAVPADKALRKQIIAECHDHPSAGHLGVTKTLQRVARRFWWPHMGRSVHAYVVACSACQLNKPSSQAPAGLLQPIPIPGDKWEQMTMDLIPGLPLTKNGYDCVVTFVDRLTKMVHFAPTTTTVNAVKLAEIYFQTCVGEASWIAQSYYFR